MPKHVKDMTRLTSLLPTDLAYAIREADGLGMDKSVAYGTIREYISGTEPHNLSVPATSGITITNYEIPTPTLGRDILVFLKDGSATNYPNIRITGVGIDFGAKIYMLNDSLSTVEISAGPGVTFQDTSTLRLSPKDAVFGIRTNDNKLHLYPLRAPGSLSAKKLDLSNATAPAWIGAYLAAGDLHQTNNVLDLAKSEIVVRPVDDACTTFHVSGMYTINASGSNRYDGASAQILQAARNAWVDGIPTWETSFFSALTDGYNSQRFLLEGQLRSIHTGSLSYNASAFAAPLVDNYYHISCMETWFDLLGATVQGVIQFETTVRQNVY